MSRYAQPTRRLAVVTGASSGIGAATALALATSGFPVALGARRTDRCEEVAAQIRASGGEAVAHALDLTDDSSVEAFAAQVSADLGDVEVVVSNAGAVAPGTIHEVDTDRFARELDLNVVGAHRLVRAFVPGMVERRRGDLVFVSSDVAVRARPFMSSYAAGKWGLEGLAHAMQMEPRGHRRARLDRAARPHLERDGHRLGRRRGGVRAQPVGPLRAGPASALPQARRARRRDHHGGQRAPRRAPQPDRGEPRGAPRGSG